MQEYYKILNVSQNATDAEIDEAYAKLKAKYSKERFYEGETGNIAARNLTKLETAYHEILESRKLKSKNSDEFDFTDIEICLKKGDLAGAQAKLDDINDRNAEWHYLQAVIFFKKNWINESKKQLEIALSMDPQNEKYASAFTKLKEKMEFNDRQFRSGNAQYSQSSQANHDYSRQMGGGSCSCFDFCAAWCCMDMLCNICCNA